jgi:TatA/E family protein of Tat protein translocase
MFSVPDIMVISVLALLLFGPERLPKMMRTAGRVMREVQNTSQSFVSEMERAADLSDRPAPPPTPPPPASETRPPNPPPSDATPT